MSRDLEGADLSEPRRSRWGRTKLIAAAVVAMLCLIWFVPLAYVRITTPPARAHDDVSDLVDRLYSPRDDDATDEWLTALAAWPVWPIFNEPPSRGMKWEAGSGGPPSPQLSDLRSGDWDPSARPTLRFLIRHISSPQMTSFLKSVTDLRERSWIWASGIEEAPVGIEGGQVRGVSRLLVTRSRYRHAELNDLQGAWNDLKTVLTLSRTATRDGLIQTLVLSACEDLAIGELRHLLREVTIGNKISDDMLETLSTLPNLEQLWHKAIESLQQDDLDEIDRRFTDDGSGNGWLVLGMQPDVESLQWSDWPKPAADRSGLWNLLSLLYHDRQTVDARIHRYWLQRLEAGLQPYAAAARTLARLDAQPLFGPADGAWLHALQRKGRGGMKNVFQLQVRSIAKRRS
ncbi:MAG: hypothetical protein IID33_05005, partial [Planctomycetes bacterium]|nr:hypothetical protein [Planctomycetota bacterium]